MKYRLERVPLIFHPFWQVVFGLLILGGIMSQLGDSWDLILGIAVSVLVLRYAENPLAILVAGLAVVVLGLHAIIALGVWADVLALTAGIIAIGTLFLRWSKRRRPRGTRGRHRL